MRIYFRLVRPVFNFDRLMGTYLLFFGYMKTILEVAAVGDADQRFRIEQCRSNLMSFSSGDRRTTEIRGWGFLCGSSHRQSGYFTYLSNQDVGFSVRSILRVRPKYALLEWVLR